MRLAKENHNWIIKLMENQSPYMNHQDLLQVFSSASTKVGESFFKEVNFTK